MPIYYNSQAIRPAPNIQIAKSFTKTNDGQTIGQLYTITLQGELVAGRGGISTTGIDTTDTSVLGDGSRHLEDLLSRQQALTALFKDEGKVLEVQGFNSLPGRKFNTRFISIDFVDGQWYHVVPYTIVLEADTELNVDDAQFAAYLNSVSETWDISHGQTSTIYSLVHTIDAQGKTKYNPDGSIDKLGWQNAKWYGLKNKGYTQFFDPGILTDITISGYTSVDYYKQNVSSSNLYNHVVQESTDQKNGSFQLQESWVVSPNPALDDYTVSINYGIDNARTTLTIDGTITGLEGLRDTNYQVQAGSSKYQNASGYFILVDTLARAVSVSNVQLNPQLLSKTVGHNQFNGIITYSYNYDNRPSNLISNAKFEQINISDINAGSVQNTVLGIIPIIGRAKGPILQNMNTSDVRTRALSISATLESTYDTPLTINDKPNIAAVTGIAIPTGTKVFLTQNQDDWDWRNGHYSAQLVWTYEV